MRQYEYDRGTELAMQRMCDENMAWRARIRRLRISQLRRMAEQAEYREVVCKCATWDDPRNKIVRLQRFRTACRAEIARLRGEG